MAQRIYSNNYLARLNGALLIGSTSLVVSTATNLPTITGSNYFYLTLDGGAVKEIIKVTAVVGTTLTVVRAQENTTAVAWADGTPIALRETAASFVDYTDATTDILTSGNIAANHLSSAYTTTATAAGTTVLTVTSTEKQYFTGALGQTLTMPVVSTLPRLGYSYTVVNLSTGSVTIQSSGANSIVVLTTNQQAVLTCIALTGTGVASWSYMLSAVTVGGGGGVAGPVSSVADSVPLFSGTGGSTLKDSAGVNAIINTMSITLGATQIATNQGFGFECFAVSNGSSNNSLAMGYRAGKAVTSAVQGTYLGSNAGLAVTTGGQSVYLGYQAGKTVTTGDSNFVGGALAGSNMGANRNNNVYVGYSAGKWMDASGNTFIGTNAGSGTSAGTTSDSVVIGKDALSNTTTSTSGYDLTVVGAGACGALTTAFEICSYGRNTCAALTTASQTCAFGVSSFQSLTTGIRNSGFGPGVGIAGATGAVALTTGPGNTLMGSRAGVSAADCANAIAVGRDSVATKETGSTSGTFGPGFSLGSAAFPVGFRGDGTLIPSTTGGAGFMKQKINGTQYYVPLYADAATTIDVVATQSDQETATSAVAAVTPSVQQFHPSASKAWLYSLYSAGVPQLSASYNITSITDNGTGDATVNIATDMSSANYCVTTGFNRSNNTGAGYVPNTYSVLAGSFRMSLVDAAGAPIDPYAFHASCFGDQ